MTNQNILWKEVVEAQYLDGYRLSILFNDGVRKTIDMEPVVNRYPVFAPLRDTTLFRAFTLTDTLEWADGTIDIAPEYLYENGV